MLMDNELLFCEDLAVTAAANATNVVDLGVARDVGVGENLYVMVAVTETMDDASDNSTLTVNLVTDDNAALTSPATVTALVTIPATTAAGTIYYVRLPVETTVAYQRFLGIAFAPANGDLSAGKFTVGLVKDIQKYKSYDSGFTIA